VTKSDRQIKYSEHLSFKLQVRHISEKLPERIYRQAKERYFDHHTQRHIAILAAIYHNRRQFMMIAYDEFEDYVEIITIHPIEKDQIQSRVTSGRWSYE
jgi:hypothetical protein